MGKGILTVQRLWFHLRPVQNGIGARIYLAALSTMASVSGVSQDSMESATLSRRANDVDGCKAADNYITLLSKGDV